MTANRLRLAGAAFAIFGLITCGLCSRVAAQQVNFVVPEPTFLIKQPKPNACWATAAAMLQSWKAKSLLPIDKAIESAGPTYVLVYKSDIGLSAKDKAGFLNALHLHSEPPATYTAQALEAKLKLWGPLWVTTAEPAGKKFSIHARVVMGILGDGSGPGTILIIADPDDGAKHTERLDTFTQKIGTLAKSDYGSGADGRPVIVHF